MNNYATQQTSSTPACSAKIVCAGLMMGLLIAQPSIRENFKFDAPLFSHHPFRIEESSQTYGQYTNQFTGEYENNSLNFEEDIASLYAQLLARQEPLGKIFDQVLHDNLWDLLVHT